METRTLIAGAVAAALVSGGLWLAWPCPTTQSTAPQRTFEIEAPRQGCAWAAGQRFAFRVASRDRWSVDLAAMVGRRVDLAAAPAQQMHASLTYEVHARILEVKQGQALMAAILRRVVATSGSDAVPQGEGHKPMLMLLNRRCGLVRLARHRDTNEEQGRLQQAAALGLSFRLPSTEEGARYEADERLALGPCRVRYGRVQHPTDGDLLFKRPLRCGGGQGPSRQIQIRGGRSRIVLGQGPWFTRLQTDLRFSLGAAGLAASGDSSASVESLVAAKDPLPARLARQDYVWGWLEGAAAGPAAQRRWPGLEGMQVDGALAEMARLMGRSDSGPGAGWRLLSAWLRANPDGASALVAAVADGRVGARRRADVFLALMHAGTPATRDALIAALADHGLGAADRARAASALSGNQAADRGAFEALRGQIGQERADDPVDLVGNSAMLGLGILSAKQRERQPELGAAVQAELRDQLQGAHAHDALAAVGNSGDDDLWPDVEKLSQSPDATLRLAAAGALRRMSPTATGAGFAKWLARREDGDVLRRLVEGYDLALLSGGNAAPPVVLGAIVKRLHETADDRLRQALIRLLGGLAAQQPAAKQALVEAFRREWNPRSKQLIGVYVDADSLTAAP